jgi:hypothetical protein
LHFAATTMTLIKRSPESGVCLKRIPYLVVVGVSNETSIACEAACELAHIAFLRFATGIAACPAIQATAPSVVVISGSLFTDEKLAVSEAARRIGARVIELPEFTSPTARAEMAVRAVLREVDEEEVEVELEVVAEEEGVVYLANIA